MCESRRSRRTLNSLVRDEGNIEGGRGLGDRGISGLRREQVGDSHGYAAAVLQTPNIEPGTFEEIPLGSMEDFPEGVYEIPERFVPKSRIEFLDGNTVRYTMKL